MSSMNNLVKQFYESDHVYPHYIAFPSVPATVSLLLKSEPIEINQKFKFLVEDVDVWKFLKTSTASRSTSIRNCIEMKIFGAEIILENGFFSCREQVFYAINLEN